MSLICAISGHVPEDPVASKSGHIFERRLIEQHLEKNTTCPVTDVEMSKDDLLPLKNNKAVAPRAAAAASIPGLISMFQNEWDAVMGETFQLKMQLDTVRQQLAYSLYQHDAAMRVLARCVRDRDAARSQLAALQHQLAQARAGQTDAIPMEVEQGITEDMVARMTEISVKLAAGRKKRQFPELTPAASVKEFSATSHPIHQSTAPGILCVDVHPTDDSRIVTGGVDQHVNIFNAFRNKLVCKLTGHSKRVLDVQFHPTKNLVISASADGTARAWRGDESDWTQNVYKSAGVMRNHKAEVTSLSFHPLGDFFITGSLDKSWAFNDANTARCIRQVDLEAGFNCLKFHPDGLILAGGTTDNVVSIWDIKSQNPVTKLEGHQGEVMSLTFSENGYYLATGSKDGCVKLWDLRKPVNFHTIQTEGDEPVNHVRFDKSSQYLAYTTNSLNIYKFETKSQISPTVTFTDHTAAVTCAAWGQNARYVASTSMDRTLKIYRLEK